MAARALKGLCFQGQVDPDGAKLDCQGEGGAGFSDTPGPGRDVHGTKRVPLSPPCPVVTVDGQTQQLHQSVR